MSMSPELPEWKECAALCSFLSLHESDLSKETRELLYERLELLVNSRRALDNPPDPY